MSDIEVALADISEIATRELAKEKKPICLEQNKKIAKIDGHTAKVTKDYLEKQLGKKVIKSENKLNYEYLDEKQIENK